MSSIIKISNVYEQKIRGNTPKAQQHLYSTPTPMIWIIIHLSCLGERREREREREGDVRYGTEFKYEITRVSIYSVNLC